MFSNLGLKTADERLRGFLYLADNLPRSKRFAGLLDNRLGNLILQPVTALSILINRKLSKTYTRDSTKNSIESKSRLIRSTKTFVSLRSSKAP